MKKTFLISGLMVFGLSMLLPVTAPLFAADCQVIGGEIESETNLLKRQALARQGVVACPDDPRINFHYAYSLERFRQYREALKHYQQAAIHDPEFAASYFGMGDMYLQLGRPEDAVKAYEFGLALAPEAGRAQRSLAEARSRLQEQATGRHDDDVTSFAGLMGLEPEQEPDPEPVVEAVPQQEEPPKAVTHLLVYAAGAGGSIAGDVSQQVVEGEDGRKVTAEPEVGYQFVAWSDGRTDNPRVDSGVSRDVTVAAGFAPVVYTVTALTGPNGDIAGRGSQPVVHGGEVGFAVKPGAGYIASAEGSCDGYFDGDLYRIGSVTADCTVNFTFAAIRDEPEDAAGVSVDEVVVEAAVEAPGVEATAVEMASPEPSTAVSDKPLEGERLGDTWWRVQGSDGAGSITESATVGQKMEQGGRLGDTWLRPLPD
ncbi:tetratricopeptide repeat protein [Desulfurivibrio alkaliphilus]|uniref:TPR repeat-containing protein n=1 Tax=Desulfurivibrio alkaliphilus (strain DSM 19089 / UNIQEM U267 / AHT2) TaxID=589865 RepID=D6Z600_DESAT|nr:tetratricopeptide repeat protein [Desulfurivibrio alkaliphilus]ADH84882.1 TPR repeat-containing protein [Desulfurivibrio alkaliphilus AHT 2]